MRPDTTRRRRRWTPKVRTGCITCRARHVKCDELRPRCRRCTDAGFPCEGFSLVPGHYVTLVTRYSSQPTMSQTPPQVNATPAELELQHYFRAEVVACAFDEFNRDLWQRHVPQASQNLPAIWHASNALAAVYRLETAESSSNRLHSRLTAEKLRLMALQQHSAAMSELMKLTSQLKLSSSDKCSVLVSNLLFLVCCAVRGDFADRQTILSNSIQLFRHWHYWQDDTPSPVPIRLILLFFVKIERLLEDEYVFSGGRFWHWNDALASLQREPLASSADACLELEMLWLGLQAMARKMPFKALDELHSAQLTRTALCERFQAWRARFQSFQSGSYVRKGDYTRIIMLKIRQTLVDVLLRVELSSTPESACWAPFNDEFAAATSLMELLVQVNQKDKHLAAPCFSLMITKSIFWMLTVCHDQSVQQRTICVLEKQVQQTISSMAPKLRTRDNCVMVINAVMNIEGATWSFAQGEAESKNTEHNKDDCGLQACAERGGGKRQHQNHEVAGTLRLTLRQGAELILQLTTDELEDRIGQVMLATTVSSS